MDPQQQPGGDPSSQPTPPPAPQPIPDSTPQPEPTAVPVNDLQPEPEVEVQPDTDGAEIHMGEVQNGTEIINPGHSFTWEASEYIAHEKGLKWYMVLWIGVAAICAALGLLHQWMSIVVVVVMALAVVMYSRKEPRVLEYALDEHGISINGRLSQYHLFKSYSVHPQLSWREIDLEPAQRFAPRLTILVEEESFDQIDGILTQHLPRLDRDHDLVEMLTRYLKF